MNRRSFLGRVVSVLAVGPLAKFSPKDISAPPTTGIVAMINTATYAFFRNRQVTETIPRTVYFGDVYADAEYTWKFVGGDVPMTDFEHRCEVIDE